MGYPLVNHNSRLSGDIVDVTGELTVDTELNEIHTVAVTLAQTVIGSDAESIVTWYPVGGYDVNGLPIGSQIVLRVEKGGANHGILGDTAVKVSWLAVGR